MRVLAATGPRPAREKLTLINGVPVILALKYSAGKRVPSRIPGAPDQMYYSLADDRPAYLPIEVGAMIDELHLAPHEPFSLCKYGPTRWDVQRAYQPGQLPPPAPDPPPPPPRPAHHATAAAAPAPAPQHQPLMNGSGEELDAILARSYASAIAITIDALEAARLKGLRILPTHEGLQACAATLFIEENKRRRP